MKTAVLVEANCWNEHPAEHVSPKERDNIKLSNFQVEKAFNYLLSKNINQHSLYESFILNTSHACEKKFIKQFIEFSNDCYSNKLLLPNFRNLLCEFCVFYKKCDRNSLKSFHNGLADDSDLNVIGPESFSIDSDYILLFGIYLYSHKVLKFCRERSLTLSRHLLKLVDDDKLLKKYMLKVLIRLFDLCASHSIKIKNISTFKSYLQSYIKNGLVKVGNESFFPYPNMLTLDNLSGDDIEPESENDENKTVIESRSYVNFSIDNNTGFESLSCLVKKDCFHFPEASTSSQNILDETPSNITKKNNLKTTPPVLNAVSTGKEELDVIDGVNIFSFETEPDMMDFTILQTKQFDSPVNDELEDFKISTSERIVPTKTRDITKIKGWKNKFFCFNKNDRNHLNIHKNLSFNSFKFNQSDTPKSTKVKIKEEPVDNGYQNLEVLLGYIPKVKVEEQNDSVTLKEQSLDSSSVIDIKCEDHGKDIDTMYLHFLSEQKFLKDLSKDVSSREKHEGIFQSDILDGFLCDRSKLDITFELPKPYFSKLQEDKVKNVAVPVKIIKPIDKEKEEKLKELLSKDFIQNMQGDLSTRKFIWVRGRPIMLEHESKKTTATSSGKKRMFNYIDESFENELDAEAKENALKKIKVTKQLEFPDAPENGPSELTIAPEEKPKRPYLSLLNTFIMDEKDENCNDHCNPILKQRFPLIFPCSNDSHLECSKFTKIQLAMILNVGYKRPFSNEVLKNLENLRKDVTTVDDMWAHIAASAVCPTKAKRTVTRYIVPVVSDSLIEVVKFNLENVSANVGKINELNVHSVYKSICASSAVQNGVPDVVENEVKDIVEDMLDYVVTRDQFESLTIPYDPDTPITKSDVKKTPIKRAKKSKVERELQRLINVSLVDDWHQTSSSANGVISCNKEYCLKGCVCNSLNGKLRVLHCGKVNCMFDCSCVSPKDYTCSSIMQRGRSRTLTKDESSWHQTVICKNNEVIEVKAGAGKSKREKKLPTRYRNNVLLGKEMNCLDYYPLSPEQPKKLNTPNKVPLSNKDKDREVKTKSKDCKVKGKDKEAKIKEAKVKETKTKEKDKEIKIIDKELKTKEVDEETKTINDSKETKLSEKLVDSESNEENNERKPNEKDRTNHSSVPENKVTFPFKIPAKKVELKPKAVISANVKHVLNQSDLDKIAKICQDEDSQLLTLADVFVWCSIHFRYNCSCSANVFSFQNNRLVWKPTANRTHLTSKHMSQIMIDKAMPKYHVFDRKSYSSRTVGSLVNYKLRNSNPVFKSKRLNEIVNNVLSSTNSFIKMDFVGLKSRTSKTSHKIKKEIDVNKSIVAVSNNAIMDKQNLMPTVSQSTIPEDRKRKRSSIDLEDNKVKQNSFIIANNKGDVVFQNPAKKKYRIGPAHFDCMGNYRAIVSSNMPSKNVLKNKANGHVGVVEQSFISPFSVEVKDHEIKALPKYGLLCLTQGFGYLPVKEFTPKKLQVQDPLSENVYHCFKDIDSANKWLNRFFKNRIIFESLNVNLKWVIVKPGILKQSQPFDKTLLENPTKIVNKDGLLVDISKINGNAKMVNSSSENHQPNEQKPRRTLDIASELGQDIIAIPVKTVPKIKSDTPKLRKILPQPPGIVKTNIITSTGILQKISKETAPLKKNVNSPVNVNNRSTFFRLNNSHDSSVVDGFIPIVPSSTSNKSHKPPNANGLKYRENNTAIFKNSKSCKSPVSEHYTSSVENKIVTRVGKTVPLKSLAGKSILKTKFK